LNRCCNGNSEQYSEQLRGSEQISFEVEVVSPERPSGVSEPPYSERRVGHSPRFTVRVADRPGTYWESNW